MSFPIKAVILRGKGVGVIEPEFDVRVFPIIGGWRWPVTCAEGAPPPLRARGKAGRGAQIEQGDEGGDLECGKLKQIASP